ncbi:hypothetical protein [Pseudoalteromonas sp. MIP2626]|uniref:hypothetical protein n=1 Tax=unclassified Pseudoalteromonas TaxID=194690 RepID=UPI001C54787C|nr:hypothetical protein [Pseudoalteromonas sp. MIP2626]
MYYSEVKEQYLAHLKQSKNSITAYKAIVNYSNKTPTEISDESFEYLEHEFEGVFFAQGSNKRQILKSTGKYLIGCFSLGGTYHLALQNKHYEDLHNTLYKPVFENLKLINDETNKALNSIGFTLEKTNKLLKKVGKVLQTKSNVTSDRKSVDQKVTLIQLKQFSDGFKTSLKAGFGGLVGGTSAIGAWGVVTIIGSASTGTAITSLSGIAATNATLAWFGGGSIAAGGAGMAGGFMVLGGIIAAPAMYFAVTGSYKKVEKIKMKKVELLAEIEKLTSLESEATAHLKTVQQHHYHITEYANHFGKLLEDNLRMFKKHSSLKYKIFGGQMNVKQEKAFNLLNQYSNELLFQLGYSNN